MRSHVSLPSDVIWSYCAGGAIAAIGLSAMVVRGGWTQARRADALILFGPLFYAAPLAAFGTEHFTLTRNIASMIPAWIPWHQFWAYFVGACFLAAALSMVTGIRARLAAALVALTFFLFVVLIDAPAWTHDPRNRFALALVLRELSFSAGALALFSSLGAARRERASDLFATIARYGIAVAVLVYSAEQFMHAAYVPGVPLRRLTPAYIYPPRAWTYFAAASYAITGALLLAGRKTRAAATWLGATVLVIELAVYVPIAVVDRASLGNGLNYLGDTLMFCGAVLLLAGAMPRAGD